MKGSSSMTTQRTPLSTFIERPENIAGRMHLRRLAVVGAMVAAAFCQSSLAIADNAPPQIVNFAASAVDGNVWVVSGTVIDDNLGSIIVELGGYLQQGTNVCPAADGSFSYSFYVPPGQFAYVAAVAYASDDNLYSQPAELMIFGF
jgi:hypothetical protein